jgi:hypothetical protein
MNKKEDRGEEGEGRRKEERRRGGPFLGTWCHFCYTLADSCSLLFSPPVTITSDDSQIAVLMAGRSYLRRLRPDGAEMALAAKGAMATMYTLPESKTPKQITTTACTYTLTQMLETLQYTTVLRSDVLFAQGINSIYSK